MKSRFLLFTCFVIILILFSSLKFHKQLEKNYIQFDVNLYASPYEVTNIEYREFLNALLASHQDELYRKSVYDSTLWNTKFETTNNNPLAAYYHSNNVYDNYPIVNISLEAANSYCNWLTSTYNNNPKRKFKKVLFRLPTEKEWIQLANPLPNQKLPWNGNQEFIYINKQQKYYCANLICIDSLGNRNYTIDGGFLTTIVGHYKPNKIGIYDVIGNVCEMTSEGKLKGGSYNNTIEESYTDKTQNYTLPDPRVGFRIVMEVIEK